MNARAVSVAAAADLGLSVHDEIDNVLGYAANVKYLCSGLDEGGDGPARTGIAPGGLPRSAADSARQAAYGQDQPFRLPGRPPGSCRSTGPKDDPGNSPNEVQRMQLRHPN